MWSPQATIAEASFLCVGSVQSGYKRSEFRSVQCSAKQLRVQGREWSMSLVNCED
jgi:hypothetical protein